MYLWQCYSFCCARLVTRGKTLAFASCKPKHLLCSFTTMSVEFLPFPALKANTPSHPTRIINVTVLVWHVGRLVDRYRCDDVTWVAAVATMSSVCCQDTYKMTTVGLTPASLHIESLSVTQSRKKFCTFYSYFTSVWHFCVFFFFTNLQFILFLPLFLKLSLLFKRCYISKTFSSLLNFYVIILFTKI